MIRATAFLKRHHIGTRDDGTPVYLKRRWRAFFIAILVGKRTVIMNATIGPPMHHAVNEHGVIIAGCTFTTIPQNVVEA